MIIRNSLKSDFSIIPNNLIIDGRLSHGSFRVMIYLLSLPDKWQINNADVQTKLSIKRRETLATYWKELIETGWISRKRLQNLNGQFIGFEYTLNSALDTKPCTILPAPVKTVYGQTSTLIKTQEQEHSNTNINNKKNKTKNNFLSVCTEWIAGYNYITGRNVKGDKQLLVNMSRILEEGFTSEDGDIVIDYIRGSRWHRETGNDTLSAIFRPTKFGEKLEKAKLWNIKLREDKYKTQETGNFIKNVCNGN